MEKIVLEELLTVLGKTFDDTLIVDDVLGPYFIIHYKDGGWGVMKTRRDSNNNLKYRVVGYPSTFAGCLDTVASAEQNEEGKIYESIQSYISNWKEICFKIRNVYKDWNIKDVK